METPTETIEIISLADILGDGLIAKAVSCMIIAVIGLIVLKIFNGFIKKRIAQGKKKEAVGFLHRVGRMLIICITVVLMLMQFDALSSAMVSLLAGSGVVAVIAGFASQDALGNLASGAMLMITRPFEVGDRIKIPDKGIDGFVETMTMRHTIVRTLLNNRMVIPNSTMNTLIIENVNMVDEKAVNIFEVGISYDSDIDLARAIIADEISSHPAFIDTRSDEAKALGTPIVGVTCSAFADSAVMLRSSFTSKDAGSGFAALSDLRISIKRRFDREGITIPFPQVVVRKE